jgi:hypothetical protein
LQKSITKHIFENLAGSFRDIFEDCEPGFQYEIFRNARFQMFDRDPKAAQSDDEIEELWFQKNEDLPIIEAAD